MSGPNPFLSELFETFGGGSVTEEQTKVAAANLEEADLLGRAMAHAYVQELGEIEKLSGSMHQDVKPYVGEGGKLDRWRKERGFGSHSMTPQREKGPSAKVPGAIRRAVESEKSRIGEGFEHLRAAAKGKGLNWATRASEAGRSIPKLRSPLAAAGLLAAGGATAYGLRKKSSMDQAQFDYMAEKVAMGVLHENNVNPYTLEPYENQQEKDSVEQYAAEQEKNAGAEMSTEDAIYARAAEMLEAVGFGV